MSIKSHNGYWVKKTIIIDFREKEHHSYPVLIIKPNPVPFNNCAALDQNISQQDRLNSFELEIEINSNLITYPTLFLAVRATLKGKKSNNG